MYLNGNLIRRGLADEDNTSYQWETFSFQSALKLKNGDGIWLEIDSKSTVTDLYGGYYTQFSGYFTRGKNRIGLK